MRAVRKVSYATNKQLVSLLVGCWIGANIDANTSFRCVFSRTWPAQLTQM
jgi:hypothetical protein